MSSLTTKKVITYSFKDLLKEKTFNKITVNDIAKKCNINRQTFYYHFQDIQDLVEWICIEETNKILNNNSNCKNWEEKFLSIFNLIRQEKVFVVNIYHSVSLEILRKNLYNMVYPIIYEEIDKISKGDKYKEEDKVFITNFYKYAFVAIVLNWVEDGMKENPQLIVNKVSKLVSGTIMQMLGEK